MYAKCGSVEDAWRVFNKMPFQNVVTWSTMILRDGKCGQGQKALRLFQQMQQEGVQPDSVTFVGVLKACASMVAIEEGRCVHQDIIQSSLESDVFVGSGLVNMYAKCGSVEAAWRVFNKMPSRTVVTWNAILGGCAMNGHGGREYGHGNALETTCGCMDACRIHGNVEMAECVTRRILEEPDNAADYGLLSNMYAAAGNWHLCENVKC
ncbi:unnamed protein product [Sphagnum troendelagicum]